MKQFLLAVAVGAGFGAAFSVGFRLAFDPVSKASKFATDIDCAKIYLEAYTNGFADCKNSKEYDALDERNVYWKRIAKD